MGKTNIYKQFGIFAGMTLADMENIREHMDEKLDEEELSGSPYLIPHYSNNFRNNIQRGRKSHTPKDPDAHPQYHKFVVHGVEIEARSKKEAFKKYRLKQIQD